MYYRDWYDGVGDAVSVRKSKEGKENSIKPGKRSLFATMGSLFMCVAACYLSGGIFGVGSLASDAPGKSLGQAMRQTNQSTGRDDASFVMSWWFEDAADSGADAVGAETNGTVDSDVHDEHIRELMEEYIASHTREGEN